MNIRSKMTPKDYHIVVSRKAKRAKCYDLAGAVRWSIPALAWGQSEDWKVTGGDTPPGAYKCGVVYTTTGEVPYGPYCIDLIDLENQETGNGRAGISLHGGGSNCPDPFADYQPLFPTHGCIRVHNYDLVNKVMKTLNFARKNHGEVYVTVIE